jgi:adenosylhomocysteine nucleosidase
LAVDMETYGVAEVCRRRQVAFSAIRAIGDVADERLPDDVERLLMQKTAAARLGAALGVLWRRPGSLKDLYRLRENALVASVRLAEVLADCVL